ncbi:MAG: hypothetical protein KGI54_05835 [Pseudomonadota bacterium]|nr:hypothetical protein [Pseudomonadota bacterium]
MIPANLKFAYDHLGRFIAPGLNPLAWTAGFGLSKKGKRTRFTNGVAVLIQPEKSTFCGITPELNENAKSSIHIEVSDMTPRDLMSLCLYNPPKGLWVGLSFVKTGVEESGIILNSSLSKAVFSENSGKNIRISYPLVLADLASALQQFPKLPSVKSLNQSFDLCKKKWFDREMTQSESVQYHREIASTPLPYVFEKLMNYSMSIYMLLDYIKFTQEKANA